MRRVLRTALVGAAVLVPAAALLGWWADGTAGLLGALAGVLLPLVFFGITVVTAVTTTRLSPGAMGAVVMVSWLVKIIGLVVALALLDRSDEWSRPAFFVAFAVAVPAWLALEAWTVISTRQAYTAPVAGDSSGTVTGVGRVRDSHDGHE
jgi:ATP synthase protein I